MATEARPTTLGRYLAFDDIGRGGMASVHLGCLAGSVGFRRLVAIKRLHPQFAGDPSFAAMLVDEARIAGRIHHPNVASVMDAIQEGDDLALVIEYVHGLSFAELRASAEGEPVPPAVAVAIVVGMLRGLHAAHELTDPEGRPAMVVHRDVSPHNVLVGVDGIPRLIDFGIAKAASRSAATREGQLKGRLRYMAPEQFNKAAERRSDVYAASVVLWEALTGRPLYSGDEGQMLYQVLTQPPVAPSELAPGINRSLDAAVLRGLAKTPEERFPTAAAMADALAEAVEPASPSKVGLWVQRLGAARLAERQAMVRKIESAPSGRSDEPAPPPERSAWRLGLALGGMVAVLAIGTWWWSLRSSSIAAEPLPALPVVSVGVAAQPAPSPTPSSAASVVASGPPEAPASASAPPRVHRPFRPPPPPAPASTGRPLGF